MAMLCLVLKKTRNWMTSRPCAHVHATICGNRIKTDTKLLDFQGKFRIFYRCTVWVLAKTIISCQTLSPIQFYIFRIWIQNGHRYSFITFHHVISQKSKRGIVYIYIFTFVNHMILIYVWKLSSCHYTMCPFNQILYFCIVTMLTLLFISWNVWRKLMT